MKEKVYKLKKQEMIDKTMRQVAPIEAFALPKPKVNPTDIQVFEHRQNKRHAKVQKAWKKVNPQLTRKMDAKSVLKKHDLEIVKEEGDELELSVMLNEQF